MITIYTFLSFVEFASAQFRGHVASWWLTKNASKVSLGLGAVSGIRAAAAKTHGLGARPALAHLQVELREHSMADTNKHACRSPTSDYLFNFEIG